MPCTLSRPLHAGRSAHLQKKTQFSVIRNSRFAHDQAVTHTTTYAPAHTHTSMYARTHTHTVETGDEVQLIFLWQTASQIISHRCYVLLQKNVMISSVHSNRLFYLLFSPLSQKTIPYIHTHSLSFKKILVNLVRILVNFKQDFKCS